ncbi:VWA domain-containing protein [Ferrimonas marina]|uniref:Ca-activated chloride channel family protein n=1 Tax=Ferrimonas marina TaxID=299255 RepID=A0A1M5VEB5_9GAMM|nr:VWA domain-containing protein [Ferrimonas marina]SHH73464.1 Ca-activated chloride channel family protein [Ferrimonas marina]
MVEAIAAFHFLRPAWLLVMLPIFALAYLQWRHRQTLGGWMAVLPPHLLKALSVGEQGWRAHLPLKLLLVAFALASLVAAGPSWQRQPSPFGEDQAAMVLLLDLSESMEQTDLAPSRLARAKQKIQDLLEARSGGRQALIAYAGSAHLAMPMTEDTQVFLPLLHGLKPQVMPRPGKFAEYALPLVAQLAEQTGGPLTLVLLSDGVGQQTAERFAEFFTDQPNQLLVWTMGDPSRPSTIPMDEAGLAVLAQAASGQLVPVTVDDGDVTKVLAALSRQMRMSEDNVMPWQDMGYGLLFPLLALFLLWFRRGWTVQWLVLFTLVTPAAEAEQWRFADLWLTPDQQGQWLFQRGEYGEAAKRFEDPMWKGVALYYDRQFAAAHSYFLRVDSPQALFNAANALAHQREYLAARALYDRLLAQSPQFPGAAQNRALVQGIIEEINRISESQANTENEASKELGEDDPQRAEGAEEQVSRQMMVPQQWQASELLADPALNERWMRRVEGDPAVFLRNKFAAEAEQ